MNTLRATLRLELEGPLLLGGHTSPATDVDATSAKVGKQIIVPASALRGALREACTRLENARRSEGTLPLTRELFGAPGPDRPTLTEGTKDLAILTSDAGSSGGLRVTDAVEGKHTLRTAVRQGVAVDRFTGSAYPGLHFQREVAGAVGQTLEAQLVCTASEEAVTLLRDALELVSGIGNSQSRGLGRVRLSLEGAEAARPGRAVSVAGDARDGSLVVDVTALEPLLLGGLPGPNNVRDSLPFVAGSALRGALADAAIRSGVSAEEPAFQAVFVDPATCLSFSDALPFGEKSTELPLAVPRSRLDCKHADDPDHEKQRSALARDTLITGWLVARCLERGGSVRPFDCKVCGRPLVAAKGWIPRAAHARRVVTRLGRDVATGSVSPGLLYSTIQIEKGARFRGTVGRVTETARALLARIEADVRLGGLRNRGLGGVTVELAKSAQLGAAAIGDRRRKLGEAVGRLWKSAAPLGIEGLPEPTRVLAVVARTDLAIAPETAPAQIGEALFGEAKHDVLAIAQSADLRSGWCLRTPGPRALRPVVAAGSAWLFAYEGTGPRDEHLARLEIEGVGEDRELGLGRLAIAPRALLQGWSER